MPKAEMGQVQHSTSTSTSTSTDVSSTSTKSKVSEPHAVHIRAANSDPGARLPLL